MAFSLEELKKKNNTGLMRTNNQSQNLSTQTSRNLSTLKNNLGLSSSKPADIEKRVDQLSAGVLKEVRNHLRANSTELIFFIDKSSSCSESARGVIKGFNELLETEKKTEFPTLITVILFGDKFEVLHYREDIKNIQGLKYQPYGNTLLFDTLKINLEKLKNAWLNDPAKSEKVIATIMTDGDDNMSQVSDEYSVRRVIDECKKLGWQFILLAANQDAYNLGKFLGIPNHTTSNFNASSNGFYLNFKAISDAINSFRKEGTINPNWSNIIKENNLRLENGNDGPTLRLGGKK